MMKLNRLHSALFNSYIAALLFTLTACSPAAQEASTAEPTPSEYFMTYKLDGKTITVNSAIVRTFENDVRYIIEGTSTVQGEVNVVLIQHDDGPPRMGTFVTNEGSLVFILGLEDRTVSTLTMLPPSLGSGEFTISEISDTYAKGRFQFIATDSDDGSNRKYRVTDGRFKARRVKH